MLQCCLFYIGKEITEINKPYEAKRWQAYYMSANVLNL